MKTIALICISFFSVVLVSSTVIAGDFYVLPVPLGAITWSQKLQASQRFKLVLDDEAVLDKETGLVWEKSPNTELRSWSNACNHCYMKWVANRKGWRPPTVEEFASLLDNDNSNPALPTNHPFSNVQVAFYWSSTTYQGYSGDAWAVHFSTGNVNDNSKNGDAYCGVCEVDTDTMVIDQGS